MQMDCNQSGYILRDNLTDIYTQAEFEHTISGKKIDHSVVIRNGIVKSLSPVEEVNGTLGLSDCQIETLSPIKKVAGELWCSFYHGKYVFFISD